jgi:hypothetical protein
VRVANDLAVRRAFEAAGVEFIDDNGGGRGVRLRKRARPREATIQLKERSMSILGK